MKTPPDALSVLGAPITLKKVKEQDFLSLTDIARYKNVNEPKDVIGNWLRSYNTIEYLGMREKLYNPSFKGVEFDAFLLQSGSNFFSLSPTRWITNTSAIGLITKIGKGGGTYAHKDIALKFASWISVEFELYLIKEYQRLKSLEEHSLDRNVKRLITKINYKIHTDAIQETLIPGELTPSQKAYVYADEADLLNVALFGHTAKQRREIYPEHKGNIRDYATIQQLIILSNMESINAELIRQGFPQSQRLEFLNMTAIKQMQSLSEMKQIAKLT